MPKGTIARIIVTKIGIDAFVLQGTDPKVLDKGPGHYEKTPLPGEQRQLGDRRTPHDARSRVPPPQRAEGRR